MTIIPQFKQCNTCGLELPADKHNFYSDECKRDGLTTRCKSCINVAQRLYREHNPEKVKETSKREYENNKPKYLERARRAREADPEAHYIKNQEYNKANPDKVKVWKAKYKRNNRHILRIKDREYHLSHREEERAYQIEWRKKNPDKRRVRDSNRRALEIGAEGSYTSGDVELLVRTQKGLCWWCGCKLNGKDYEVDHRIALTKGGSNNPNNLCISCKACNRSKGAKFPWEWNGRLL